MEHQDPYDPFGDDTAQAQGAPCTLPDLLALTGRTRPRAPAVTDGGITLDWEEFSARIEGLAGHLARLGAARGTPIALWLPNGITYLAAIFATARIGGLCVHINTRYGPAEVGDILSRTNATILVTRADFPPVDFLGVLRRTAPGSRHSLQHVVCEGLREAGRLDGARVQPIESHALPVSPRDVPRPDDPCLTYTTGGTTSRPKIVVHEHRSIARHAFDVSRAIRIDESSALLAAVPFCGTFGNVAAMAMLAGGGHVVCMDTFEPQAGDDLIRRHGVTHGVGDDRMLGRLAATAIEGRGAHETMRFFGAALFTPKGRQAWSLGVEAGLSPHTIYGSSEAQALFAVGFTAGDPDAPVLPTSPDAAFGIDGKDTGDDGELLLKGPSLFQGYWDDARIVAPARQDGFHRTGDQASRAEGGFRFEGRIGDALRLGGFLVSPLEIEHFIESLPGIESAQIVAVDGPRGTAPFAFVKCLPGHEFQERDLLDRCRDGLARYKIPIGAMAVEDFPYVTGPNGPKLSRATLRALAADVMRDKASPV